MKAHRWMKQAIAAASLAAVLLAGACASPGEATTDREHPYTIGSSLYTRDPYGGRPPAPAPAAREEPREQPREQPRQATRRGCEPVVAADQTVVTQAFPTGEMASSAIVVHTVMPREVRVNQPYEYQLQVCNLTNAELQNVVVTGESTNNLEIMSADPSPSRGPGGNPQWVLGALGPSEMEIITVTGRATESGISSNCVAVSYNNFLCAETRVVEPALAVRKTATPEVLICDPIQMTYVVTNSGTGSCDNVVVTDKLPAGLTLADGGTTVTFNAGSLAAGQSKEHRVNVKASKTGRYSSPASATSDCGADATAEPVTTVVRQPVLALEAECGERVFLGRNVTFTFNLTSSGDAACNETTISATLPSGSAFVSADNGGQLSGNTVVWNVGTLSAQGGERSVSMVVRPEATSTLRTTATAECVCAAQVTDTCETRVEGIPAILLEVIDSNDPIQIGEEVTYVVQVTNQGSAPGTGIRIVCELPEQETFVSAGGATAGTLSGRTVTFAPLPSLPPKARAEFRITVRANAPGDVRFLTSLSSDQFERPIQETESTNLYE